MRSISLNLIYKKNEIMDIEKQQLRLLTYFQN